MRTTGLDLPRAWAQSFRILFKGNLDLRAWFQDLLCPQTQGAASFHLSIAGKETRKLRKVQSEKQVRKSSGFSKKKTKRERKHVPHLGLLLSLLQWGL